MSLQQERARLGGLAAVAKYGGTVLASKMLAGKMRKLEAQAREMHPDWNDDQIRQCAEHLRLAQLARARLARKRR